MGLRLSHVGPLRPAGRTRLVARGVSGASSKSALLLLFLAVALAACGGGAGTAEPTPPPLRPEDGALTVRGFEWGFEPQAIALRLGEPVRIVFENDGRTLHNFKIEELAADDIDSESSGPLSAKEGQLFVGAEAGQRGTLRFVPQEAGSFVFYCTIRRHRELGMNGTLIVE